MSGLADIGYRVLMRRNSIYLAFVFGGAVVGERLVNKAFNVAWESNNEGKLFKDLVKNLPPPEEQISGDSTSGGGGGEEE